MQLRTYLRDSGVSVNEFASSVGADDKTIYSYLIGRRRPHPRILQRIREVTHGSVQPNDFYGPSSVMDITLRTKESQPSEE